MVRSKGGRRTLTSILAIIFADGVDSEQDPHICLAMSDLKTAKMGHFRRPIFGPVGPHKNRNLQFSLDLVACPIVPPRRRISSHSTSFVEFKGEGNEISETET